MKSCDIVPNAFDLMADTIQVDETAADELLAVAGLLEGQPLLRRSLPGPSASGRDRQTLARGLFEGRLGATALSVVTKVTYRPWPSGRTMIDAIERWGVYGLLYTVNECGELKRVQEGLHRFTLVIDGSPELSDTLHSRGRVLADRHTLITRLLADRMAPVTKRLASRAAAACTCTVPLTLTSCLALATDLAGERMARVAMAHPPDKGRTEQLRRALGAQVGDPVLLQITVDENVVGSMSVDLGTHVSESAVTEWLNEAHRLLN